MQITDYIQIRRPAALTFFACLGVCALLAAPARAQGAGGPAGVDIKVRALNLSADDTPFCGIGGGMAGDRLDLDAFMDMNGIVTGTARFETALHQVTLIELDRAFMFPGGGLGVRNESSGNTVAIWMSDTLAAFGLTPALVNLEFGPGCETTQATFTPGVDKVTVQINFR